MRESIRNDRARIQLGRISNFGLLEMTRQRLREGSIKWETQLSLDSFSQKILKKIQHLAFTNKIKIIKASIPQKIKNYIEENFYDEIKYFQKKYLFKIELNADESLIIPEYKIELFNKAKKLIDISEHINKISSLKKIAKVEKKSQKKDKKESKKVKTKKNLRTLWVRKKKVK